MADKLVGRADDDGIPPGYVAVDDQGHYMYFWDTRVCHGNLLFRLSFNQNYPSPLLPSPSALIITT